MSKSAPSVVAPTARPTASKPAAPRRGTNGRTPHAVAYALGHGARRNGHATSNGNGAATNGRLAVLEHDLPLPSLDGEFEEY